MRVVWRRLPFRGLRDGSLDPGNDNRIAVLFFWRTGMTPTARNVLLPMLWGEAGAELVSDKATWRFSCTATTSLERQPVSTK